MTERLSPEEPRERLWSTVLEASHQPRPTDLGSDPLDAILVTVDALAALVTWPKLLEAGERAGKMVKMGPTVGQHVNHRAWALKQEAPRGIAF